MDRILPTGDLAIKKVLASEENKDILTGLIEDFFDIVVEDLTIVNPYSIAAYREFDKGGEIEIAVLRQTINDVAATFKTADFVSEAQVQKSSFFDERSLLYPLERFCGNYNKAGNMALDPQGRPIRYSSLRPVYSLNILGYTHFPDDDDALRIFELFDAKRNKRHKKDYLRIGYFELTKSRIETQKQRYWHDYFKTGEAAPEAPGYIRKASSIIEFSNLTEEELKMARTLERAQATYDADMYGSYIEGKAEGIELIARLLREGVSVDEALKKAMDTIKTKDDKPD